MGIPDDCEINFNFDIVDYADFNINLEPPTPPPLPTSLLTPLPISLAPSPEPVIKSDFDDVPMEVNFMCLIN